MNQFVQPPHLMGALTVDVASKAIHHIDSDHSATTASSSAETPLPKDYKPGDDDVMCGRGKVCFRHEGNRRFRRIVDGLLHEYSATRTKAEKSTILATVIQQVRDKGGDFIKYDKKLQQWFLVGDFLAREKTSQAFRNALHEKYRSSNLSKKRRRRLEQVEAYAKKTRYPASSGLVEIPLRNTTNPTRGNQNDSSHIDSFLTQKNIEILNLLQCQSKSDDSSTGSEPRRVSFTLDDMPDPRPIKESGAPPSPQPAPTANYCDTPQIPNSFDFPQPNPSWRMGMMGFEMPAAATSNFQQTPDNALPWNNNYHEQPIMRHSFPPPQRLEEFAADDLEPILF